MNFGRKLTGGKYHKQKKKRLYEKASSEREVFLGETKRKTIKCRSAIAKTTLLKSNIVNLAKNKKVIKTTIKNVLETPQNNFLARQNRLMKGAIIETPEGKAKITNRPGQEGQVNAVLIEQK